MKSNESSYKFEFTWENNLRVRHSERALIYAKKENSLKFLAHDYGCSTTSLKNSYSKVCRNIYWQIKTKFKDSFSESDINSLYESQFKNQTGIALIENFYKCMKDLDEINPSKNILDIHEKEKSIEQIYNVKLNLIIDRISKKRAKMIEQINHDFDLLDKWLNDL